MMKILRKSMFGIARRIGPLRQWAWNAQFRQPWPEARSGTILSLVEKYAKGGYVIELGCGDGALIRALKPEVYSRWCGIDISPVALERARSHNTPNATWMVSDLNDWKQDQDASLIVIEEAIYYLVGEPQVALLNRCLASLVDDGAILVAVHDRKRHEESIRVCKATCRVIEEIETDGRCYLILGKP